MSQDLQAFIRLAKCGNTDGCSAAEFGASVLAEDVIEHVFDFDDQVLRGLVTFIGIAKVTPARAMELLD